VVERTFTIKSAPQGWSAHPRMKGGEKMVSVYDAIDLALNLGIFALHWWVRS
jgi:hypothetical protein